MMAELETISMPARNRLWVDGQPRDAPNSRHRFRTNRALTAVPKTAERPNRCRRPRLRPSPMENTRNTRPNSASICTRSTLATSWNGGV